MSEGKELDPTPARIARARREGNVPRSAELVAAAAFGAASIAACAVLPPMAALARHALAQAAYGARAWPDEAEIVALALLPAAAGAAFAMLAGLAQGTSANAAALAPRASRLDPAEGLRRMLSRETPAHAARALLAFGVAAGAIGPAMGAAVLASTQALQIPGVAAAAWSGTRRALFVACTVGLLFAAAEYRLVRSAWLRKLRMSLDELKREMKEQEGDPHVRRRRSSRHRELSYGGVAAVREAAFVVANPTHVAVALAYRPPAIAVPRVLLRAADAAALRVRELAGQSGVPVVDAPELARTLFSNGRVGAAIPVEHYVAVAAIVVALTNEGRLEG